MADRAAEAGTRKTGADRNDLDRVFMARALELAERGRGTTRPNPLVGSVIVRGDQIVAEGYHRRAGSDHAEVVALKKAGRRARGATVYVTLEPCCHTGSTGPCCEALVDAGVSRVVVPTLDPNPIVNGRGLRRLKQAGIEVRRGVLKREAERLNDIYFGRLRNNRPYVILKSAQTLDGRIASVTGDSRWITSEAARTVGHRLRSEVDAVVVGSQTVRTDNPSLTVRHFNGINPYRVVVTSSGRLPKNVKLFDDNADSRTIVAAPSAVVSKLTKRRRRGNLTYWSVKTNRRGELDMHDLLRCASEFGVHSLLVEGGGRLAASFLRSKLVDKQVVFVAPIVLGSGVAAVADLGLRKIAQGVTLDDVQIERIGRDVMITGYPQFGGK